MYFTSAKKLRLAVLALALLVMTALTIGLLLGGERPTAPQGGVLQRVTWNDGELHLEGRVAPQVAVTATVDDKLQQAQADNDGVFTVDFALPVSPPARLKLEAGDTVYDILIIRWRGRWLALQRPQGMAAWEPVLGYPHSPYVGLAVLTRANDMYGLTFHIPRDATTDGAVYIYGDRQLVMTQATPSPLVSLALPTQTGHVRLDVHDAAGVLQHRAAIALPPADSSARYNLHDGDVWLFTNLSAQRTDADDVVPGQFVPVPAAK